MPGWQQDSSQVARPDLTPISPSAEDVFSNNNNNNHRHYDQQYTPPQHYRPQTPVSPPLPEFPLPKQSGVVPIAKRQKDASDMTHPTSSPAMSRNGSVSSFSTVSARTASTLPCTPANVHPSPAYIAPFGVNQVLGGENHLGSKPPSSDDEQCRTPSSTANDVNFSPAALSLVNAFLDQLLYSILSHAKSTSLKALRPAVSDVLKSRLASAAISSAEEELQELLGNGDEDEIDEEEEAEYEEDAQTDGDDPDARQQIPADQKRKWDLELVWKRTRLRVMVYCRLGDMEDEDEERHVREEEIFRGGEKRFPHSTGLVSWAAAIFLTSVLEYIAEQVLQVAVKAAAGRIQRQRKSQRATASGGVVIPADGTTVEDFDMEKVALNSSLGRLWRTWRKSLRNHANGSISGKPSTPINQLSNLIENSTSGRALSRRSSSFGTAPESFSPKGRPRSQSDSPQIRRSPPEDGSDAVPEAQYSEHVLAANIPLPMGDTKRDVDEIEVPGLAPDPDQEDAAKDENEDPKSMRPKSLVGSFPSWTLNGLLQSDAFHPESWQSFREFGKPLKTRKRSLSSPTSASALYSKIQQPVRTARDRNVDDAVIEEPKVDDADKPLNEQESSTSNKQEEDKDVTNEQADETEGKSVQNGLVEGVVAGASAAAAVAATAVAAFVGSRGNKISADSSPKQTERTEELEDDDPDAEALDKQQHLGSTNRISVMPPRTDSLQKRPEQPENSTSTAIPSTQPTNMPGVVAPLSTRDRALMDQKKQEPTRDIVQEPVSHAQQVPAEVPDVRAITEQNTSTIGIAQTSDNVVPTPPNGNAGEWFVHAKGMSGDHKGILPRSTRLDLVPSPPASPPRKQENVITKLDERVNGAKDSPEDRPAPLSLPAKSQNRPSQLLPQALAPSHSAKAVRGERVMSGEVSPLRPEFVPVSDPHAPLPSPARSQFSEPISPVQEHPVIQKIAGLKGNEDKVNEIYKAQPLTSASIKGPEDFDLFVQGGDTVKYTLTPENVRDVPVSTETKNFSYVQQQVAHEKQSPVNTTFSSRSGRGEAMPSPTARSLPSPTDPRPARTAIFKKVAAVAAPTSPSTSNFSNTSTGEKGPWQSISRSSLRNVSESKKSGLMAREPRVVAQSTRDFADFIRSTGPTKEPEAPAVSNNRSTISLQSARSTPESDLRSYSPGGTSNKSLNLTSAPAANIPPVPRVPTVKNNKASLQPKSATSISSGSADLIDFIRRGPDENAKQHRIPRNVAPFRTTQDSDMLNEWGDKIDSQPGVKLATDAPSTTLSNSSNGTSNSRSLQVNQAGPTSNGRSNRLSTVPVAETSDPSGGEPVRKRVRNKDPYAIDFDDDDMEELFAALPKYRQDESITDFLSNNEPPANNSPQLLANGHRTAPSSRATQNGQPQPQRRNSGHGYLNVLGADAVSSRRPNLSKNLSASQTPTTNTTKTQTVTSTASGPLSRPSTRKKMEARSSGSREINTSSTTELADFLRNSAPPFESMNNNIKPSTPTPSSNTATTTNSQSRSSSKPLTPVTKLDKKKPQEKGRGFGSSFFSRSGRKTYLDM